MNIESLLKLAAAFNKYVMDEDGWEGLVDENGQEVKEEEPKDVHLVTRMGPDDREDLLEIEDDDYTQYDRDMDEARKQLIKDLDEDRKKHDPAAQRDEQNARLEKEALDRANLAVKMEGKKLVFNTIDEAVEYFAGACKCDKRLAALKLLSETAEGLADEIRRAEGKKTRLKELLERFTSSTTGEDTTSLEDFDF